MKRCSKCKKPLYEHNQTLLCAFHSAEKWRNVNNIGNAKEGKDENGKRNKR